MHQGHWQPVLHIQLQHFEEYFVNEVAVDVLDFGEHLNDGFKFYLIVLVVVDFMVNALLRYHLQHHHPQNERVWFLYVDMRVKLVLSEGSNELWR